MRPPDDSFRLLLISLARCLRQHQRDVIDYLVRMELAENQRLKGR